MYGRVLAAGIGLWVLGTLVFRLAGSGIIHPAKPLPTTMSYLVNAALALVVSGLILRWVGVPANARPAAVTLFILPTLVLDAFSTAFFPAVFPNLPPAAAPVFGGLMLVSAAGAVIGAWLPLPF